MNFNRFIEISDDTLKTKVLKKMREKFVKTEITGLMWNAFIEKPKCFHFDKIDTLKIPMDKEIFFYLERQGILYKTTIENIINMIAELEPWEEVDAYAFDQDMQWIVAITHENVLLTIGI